MQDSSLLELVPEIPGYRLLDKIGEGGMGEVYRATQLNLQRMVAVKYLHLFPGEPAALPAFLRESRLMAALAHPHVVTIYDCGEVEGRQFLVMEYLAGSTLRSRMRPGRPWSAARAAPVLDAIAQALAYIHEQGILHLDLKPENVLCTERGDVKITDFGLAVSRLDARTLSELGLVQGTLDYCPPEQRYGLTLDPRSDVFSLATVAYELLTGRLPGRVFVPASYQNRSLPRAGDDVLRRGLARDPDERTGSVEEFRGELAQALRMPVPFHVRWRAHAAVGVMALLALLLVLRWPFGQGARPAEPVELPSQPVFPVGPARIACYPGAGPLLFPSNRTGSSNIFLFEPDGGEPKNLTNDPDQNGDPIWSPDGARIAFTSNRHGTMNIYVMDADGGNLKQLTNDQGNNRAPTWSADGKRLAFASDRNASERNREQEVWVMDTDGSNQTNLTDYPGYHGDPAWSPDGAKIVFASKRDGQTGFRLFVMDADGKNAQAITQRNNPSGMVYPAWSPDGKTIAYGDSTFDSLEIFACDSDGTHKRQLTKLGGSNSRAAWSPDGKLIAFQHAGDGPATSLYIMGADGSNPVEILKAEGPFEGGRPAWKPK